MLKYYSLWILFFGVHCDLAVLASQKPVVSTLFGKVQGEESRSRDGRTFYQFLGVPYAIAERFQPPTRPYPWDGIRDATNLGQVCPQLDLKLKNNEHPNIIGSEDCLNVNIYTPQLPQYAYGSNSFLLPVIVFFESGGFITGSGNYYGPEYFMDTDSILVTINSRVGPFGFLNLGHEKAAGNQGLKDQVGALTWVKENIANFGGDNSRVTIFGSGSGSAAVQYHLLSPLSKGLFQNAISQTGGSLSPWAFSLKPVEQAKKFGQSVGCPVDSKDNLIQCLKSKDAEELVGLDYNNAAYADSEMILWEPSAETVNPHQAFLKHNPSVLVAHGRFESRVPLVIGVNILDGAIPALAKKLADPSYLDALDTEWYSKAPALLDYARTSSDHIAMSEKIRNLYFDGWGLSHHNVFRLIDIIADRCFFVPALKFAQEYSKLAPTYTFVITHEGQFSQFELPGLRTNGSAYYDDLQYGFPLQHYGFPEITPESYEYYFSKNYVRLWASFAANSYPTSTWGSRRTWNKFNATEVPITLFEIDSDTGTYVIPQDMINRHTLWAEFRASVLTAEDQDPPEELFESI